MVFASVSGSTNDRATILPFVRDNMFPRVSTTHHCGDPTRPGDSVAVITSGGIQGAAWLHLVLERDCVTWAGLSVTNS